VNTNAKIHDANWQILGELELPSDVSTDEAVHAWLVYVLAHFNLSLTFWEMVLKSAQESARHALQTTTLNGRSYIHISILTPRDQTLAGKSWGFFHIERTEPRVDVINANHYAIDFFLYVEGD